MIITFNLHDGKFAYTDSVAQLRSLLAMHGGREGYFQLDLVLERDGVPEVSLLMSRKTLYIDAFRGGDNLWHYFSDSPRPNVAQLGIAGNVARLKTAGTHTALRTATAACVYDGHTRFKLRQLARFHAGGNDEALKVPLSFAVVSCAEAVRFKAAEDSIARLLTGAIVSYKPLDDWQTTYKNWESLTQANSARVWVRHAG
jgi:hypothetical protein